MICACLSPNSALQRALGLLVAGVRLAGEHDLHGAVAAEQRRSSSPDRASAARAACTSRRGARSRSSARRDRTPARRPRRTRAGRRGRAGRRTLRSRTNDDQLRALALARLPQLLVGDLVDRRPRLRVGRARRASPGRGGGRAARASGRRSRSGRGRRWSRSRSAPCRPARSGHSACHISRATSPWRRLTALAARLSRSAACVTPNGSSCVLAGRVRPSAISVRDVEHASSDDEPPIARSTCSRRVGVVAGRHRRVGGEHGPARARPRARPPSGSPGAQPLAARARAARARRGPR